MPKTKTNKPVVADLKTRQYYFWCTCGQSSTSVFCDGTHEGRKNRPIVFEVKEDGSYALCACLKTKTPPFCDDQQCK